MMDELSVSQVPNKNCNHQYDVNLWDVAEGQGKNHLDSHFEVLVGVAYQP